MIKTATRIIRMRQRDAGNGLADTPGDTHVTTTEDSALLQKQTPQRGSVGGRWVWTLVRIVLFGLTCWLAIWPSVSSVVRLAALFWLACTVSASFTRFVRKAAPYVGLVDRPDRRRKLHAKEMPLGGGAAIFTSTVVVILALLVVPNPWQASFRQMAVDLAPLLAASAVIVIVGLADDRYGLRGRHKVLGQCAAAGTLMLGGFLIRSIGIFGWHVELGLLTIPFTLFWLLGAINSLNLLDGIDGLVTTVGLILVSAIAGIAALTGHIEIALGAVVFAGSLLGFLLFNLPPASIFLGDAGSMLIGLVIGVLSIEGSLKGPGTALLAAPLVIWTIPVFDSAAAVLRRKLTGRTLYAPDRGHIHHRLLNRLGSNRSVLGLIGMTCVLTSVAAIISVFLKSDVVALVTGVAVVAVFVLTGLFGRVELSLLIGHCRRFARGYLLRGDTVQEELCEEVLHLQGSRDWGLLWNVLAEAKQQPQLTEIRLYIHWPAAHEEFHAMWRKPPGVDTDRRWRMEIPLAVARQSLVGTLTVFGEVEEPPMRSALEPALALANDLECRLKDFVADVSPSEPEAGALPTIAREDHRSQPALAQRHPK